MKLNERLNEFVGHDVVIITLNDEGEIKIPEVILEEVGEDYLTVMTKYDEKTQYSPPNERRFVNLSNIVQVVYKPGCDKYSR